MKQTLASVFSFYKCISLVWSQTSQGPGQRNTDCQQRSTSGRDYIGEINTTVDGIPCQKWSDTQPHDHDFTDVGYHNFCRNPDGDSAVWCHTTNPDVEWQNCSVPFCPPLILKALDFSLDNDDESDENNSYTHASLQKEKLPPSFTICTAFMVESWASYSAAMLYVLLDDDEEVWHWVQIFIGPSYTEFYFVFEDSPEFSNQSEILVFPFQWTRVCLSRDSNTSIVRLVIDGELFVEKDVEVQKNPDDLNLVLGTDGHGSEEHPGQTTNLNMFSSALTVEEMKSLTSPGKGECGLAGDFLSWEKSVAEELWTLHSKARWVDLDGELEGPCRAEAKLNIFPMNEDHHHSDCMKHCSKLGGRSPSVKTKKEWENLLKEIEAVSPDPSWLPSRIWLPATEGNLDEQIGELDHWTEGVEAKEGVWRDYYTGEQLENYTKSWDNLNGDKQMGSGHNCIHFFPQDSKWSEWQCWGSSRGCPCSYDSSPLIHLRGFCPDTDLEHIRYTVTQLGTDPNNIIIVGTENAQIKYSSSLSQWVYTDLRLNVTARSRASQNSFALGKHNWTITGDYFQCSKGKDYEIELKLTGCNDNEFTCHDGHCIEMEKRCDQLPQCEDKSDEQNCKLLILEHGYNKEVPPTVVSKGTKEKKLLPVRVALTLQKVVAIQEVDYSISFKFGIILKWLENRVTYQNLKKDTTNNLLRQEEVRMIWLPLLIYWNTDQDETTRLGVEWEWKTTVMVQREAKAESNPLADIDEAEIFQGAENTLRMEQTYTHAFQCVFKLSKYPFDTQVLHLVYVLFSH